MMTAPESRGENTLAQWLQVLNFFEATTNEAQGDNTVHLIKQYARLQISSLQQLRRDYKDVFGTACSEKMRRNKIILALLDHLQENVFNPHDPKTRPNDMMALDFNADQFQYHSRGHPLRLVPGTVIERTYRGQTHTVYCRDGYYEYNQKRYSSLSKVVDDIAGYHLSGKTFFGRKSRMYLL